MTRRNARTPREPVEITIEGLSHEGRGVGRIDGKTVFVHGALPGERVVARILRRRGKFDEAETVAVLEESKERIEPACPHFGVCGGCSAQHMNEDFQLRHKQDVLLELLEHHGGCRPTRVAAPIRGPQWGYRRKARLGVKHVPKKGGVLVGFRERAKPYVTDCTRCDILDPRIGERLPALRALIESLSITARVPQIEVAAADDVAALVFRHLEPLSTSDRAALAGFADQTGLEIYLQSGGPDTVVPLREGVRPLVYRLSGLDFGFDATDFTQVNADINASMVSAAIAYLGLEGDDEVVDLFCGIGNFSLPVARQGVSVIGIEGDPRLVRRARQNALANGIDSCTFLAADLSDPKTLAALELGRSNKLLLDPPRAGALEVFESVSFKGITRVVYVSCNPVTLARDTAVLCQRHGYELRESGVLDMFPQTSHFESISLFEKP